MAYGTAPGAPTLITIARLLLAPAVAYLIIAERYGAALAVFVIAGLSDVVDGAIARRFGLVSELGARLDPIADKVLMLAAAIPLAGQALLPVWLVAAIVVRDVVILAGAVAYRIVVGRIDMAPSLLSKLNTGLELIVITAALLGAAGLPAAFDWLPWLCVLVLVTVVSSGAQYVWVWARKAISAHRARTR
jgi:cardiolipin synthase